jgi:hypothetical protein
MYYGPWANWHHDGTVVKTIKSIKKKKKKKKERREKGCFLRI